MKTGDRVRLVSGETGTVIEGPSPLYSGHIGEFYVSVRLDEPRRTDNGTLCDQWAFRINTLTKTGDDGTAEAKT